MTGYARDFEEALATWDSMRKASNAPPLLVYVLEDCPRGSPELSKLTGADPFKATYLLERCRAQSMCAYFASLSCTVDDYSETRNLDLQYMINLDESKTPKATPEIDVDCLIQEAFFDDRESNDGDSYRDPYEEYSEHHHTYMVRTNFSCVTSRCLSRSTNPSIGYPKPWQAECKSLGVISNHRCLWKKTRDHGFGKEDKNAAHSYFPYVFPSQIV